MKDINKKRHSLSHLLAMAVLEKFPRAKLGIGPTIENGFYYDFDGIKISDEDLPKLEKAMLELIAQDLKFIKKNITTAEAKKIFSAKGGSALGGKNQPYKLELIKELIKNKKSITIYKSGDFTDLCAGPHVKSTKEINPEGFKLVKTAGAYWRGSEKNKMLTRIYGLAFETKKDLEDYLKLQEEAEKRDHRKIGKDLELFIIDETVGQGLPLWLPRGAIMRQVMEDFVLKEYLKNGYQLVRTPHIGSEKLFGISGHLDFYKESMYAPVEIENEKYYLKPMNCPMHIRIYQNSPKSYRDLPVRYTELGTVYRYEKSGTLHGLIRVRGFTQDDGHILCREDQLGEEIFRAVKLTKHILESFGFRNFKVALSVRDLKNKKKYLGNDKDWKKSEEALIKGIKEAGWNYEREEGEAVFYGPKMDIKTTDAIGREWQISTLQVDFNLPKKFDVFYTDKDGKKKQVFMLHRALLGSLERFVGILIEHYAGAFPVWLSPVQTRILPVSEKFNDYAEKILEELKNADVRTEIGESNETLGKRIRSAELQKIPYILVVGEKEKQAGTVAVRERGKGDLGAIPLKNFIEKIKKEISEKK